MRGGLYYWFSWKKCFSETPYYTPMQNCDITVKNLWWKLWLNWKFALNYIWCKTPMWLTQGAEWTFRYLDNSCKSFCESTKIRQRILPYPTSLKVGRYLMKDFLKSLLITWHILLLWTIINLFSLCIRSSYWDVHFFLAKNLLFTFWTELRAINSNRYQLMIFKTQT